MGTCVVKLTACVYGRCGHDVAHCHGDPENRRQPEL